MKNVLVITSNFPPLGGIAQQRIASFVRHLPSCGWNPSVITIDWTRRNSNFIDDSLRDDVLEHRVIFRSSEPDLRKGGSPLPPLIRPSGFGLDWRAALMQIRDRLRHGERVEGSQYFYRAALRFLKDHLEEHHYDAILATSPDLAAHRIACEVSEHSGIPWVADCRDDYAMFKADKPAFVELEKHCLENAALVVTVSKGLQHAIGNRIGKRVEVVENGFEKAALDTPRSTGRHLEAECLHFVYTGSLANYLPERDPTILLEGIARFLKRRKAGVGRPPIRFNFFGDLNLKPWIDKLVSRLPILKDVIVDHGFVPMSVAHEVQREADVLVLLAHPGAKGILTGKVFEYLAARRPIVSVPGDGDELDELLKRSATGTSIPDLETAETYVTKLAARWIEGEGELPDLNITRELMAYERSALTGRLAALMDGLGAGAHDPA